MPVISKVFLQAIALLAMTASMTADGKCWYGTSEFGGSCYGFGKDKLSWFEAQVACQSIGANLAVINSRGENDFLVKIAKENLGSSSAWIGGISPIRTPVLHNFVWAGTQRKNVPFNFIKINTEFSNWGVYQPNYDDQNCMFLYAKDGFKWHDYHCTSRQSYICELKQ